jgi:HPt (histidine-containing phosphotransfer) domain-containing protein
VDRSAGQPADWPVVDGISTSDAAMRMGHNVRLFAQTLNRIFDEYGDLMKTPLAAPLPEEAKQPMAARMHKLKGNAGLVGAAPIAGIAGEIETELLNADAPQSTDVLLAKLGDALRALKAASAPVIGEILNAPPSSDADKAEISAEAIEELAGLLRGNDIAAMSLFDRLAPSLRSAAGAERFASIEAAVTSLQFDLALSELTRACEATPDLPSLRRSA